MRIYSDINIEYGITNYDFLLYDHEAIQQALIVMMRATRTGRFMRPNLKSPLWNFLMRPMNENTAKDIMYEIENMVKSREPRVKIILGKSNIHIDRVNKKYDITVHYAVVETDEEGDVSTFIQSVG